MPFPDSAPSRPERTETLPVRVHAPLIEVFSSIQGEGLYVGEPQVLMRLAGCPLRCRWCDTPSSRGIADDQETLRRVSPFEAATLISEVDPGGSLPVSVTGGEPLLWPDFLLDLRTLLPSRRLHLETAGAHPDALERVIDAVQHVSLDLKLPADLDPPVDTPRHPGEDPARDQEPVPHGDAEWAGVRARILPRLRERHAEGIRDACAKIVVNGGVAASRFDPLLDDVAALYPTLPLFLQPVTPTRRCDAPEPALLLAIVDAARERALHVRVIPQIHPVLGLA